MHYWIPSESLHGLVDKIFQNLRQSLFHITKCTIWAWCNIWYSICLVLFSVCGLIDWIYRYFKAYNSCMKEENLCEYTKYVQWKFYRYQTIVKEGGHIWKLYAKRTFNVKSLFSYFYCPNIYFRFMETLSTTISVELV